MAILSMFIVAATISEFSDISPATITGFSIKKGVMKKKKTFKTCKAPTIVYLLRICIRIRM